MIELTKAFTEVHRYDDRKTYKEAWTAWLAHDEIDTMIKAEVARLTDLGYQGDVADKLYKSGRYYFRTREPTVPHTPPSVAQRHDRAVGTSAIGTSRTPNDANGRRRGSGPKALNALNQGSIHADTKPLGVRDVPIALVPTARPCLCAPRKYVLINRDLLDAMDDHIACGLRSDDAYTPARGFAEFCKLNDDSYRSAYRSAYRSEVTRLSEIMPTGEAVHDKLKKTYKNRYFMIVNAGH
jgi:hypothetical protein